MNFENLKEAVKYTVSLVVKGDFGTLRQQGMLGPSSEAEYLDALNSYVVKNGELVIPPDEGFDDMEIYSTKEDGILRVDFDLWDVSGPCDLTAQIYIKKLNDTRIGAKLYDLRVM